jgi:hypothetical protein
VLKFEWNALRVGDDVMVHNDGTPDMRLDRGVVVLVQPAVGSNEVAVRIVAADGAKRTVRPRRAAVHQGRDERLDECWRCTLAPV